MCTLVATWIIAIAAVAAAIVAFIHLRRVSKQIRIGTFSALLQEISGEEASVDRGIVYLEFRPNNDLNSIRDKIEASREKINSQVSKGKTSKVFLPGAAAERTIARLDRVGFFIIGEENSKRKLSKDTPDWLWTLVADVWIRLGKWVEFRQNQEEAGEDWHPGYGKYLAKLKLEADKIGRVKEIKKKYKVENST